MLFLLFILAASELVGRQALLDPPLFFILHLMKLSLFTIGFGADTDDADADDDADAADDDDDGTWILNSD